MLEPFALDSVDNFSSRAWPAEGMAAEAASWALPITVLHLLRLSLFSFSLVASAHAVPGSAGSDVCVSDGLAAVLSMSLHSIFLFFLPDNRVFSLFLHLQCGFFKRDKYEDNIPSYSAVRIKRDERAAVDPADGKWENVEKKPWMTTWHDNEHYS